MNIKELKELLVNYHTAEELVVLLSISSEDLLDRFEDMLEENIYKFDYDSNYGDEDE